MNTPLTTYFKSFDAQLKIALSVFLDTSAIEIACSENDYEDGIWCIQVCVNQNQPNGVPTTAASAYMRFPKNASNDEMGDAAEVMVKQLIAQTVNYASARGLCTLSSQGVFRTPAPKQTDSGVFIAAPKCLKLFDD